MYILLYVFSKAWQQNTKNKEKILVINNFELLFYELTFHCTLASFLCVPRLDDDGKVSHKGVSAPPATE